MISSLHRALITSKTTYQRSNFQARIPAPAGILGVLRCDQVWLPPPVTTVRQSTARINHAGV